jgi:glycosyltransferase involved in cell wall biosynthesis
MKVSIAMATYNGAQYLKAQLQSFTNQTRHPDELIITDDCSTDETETIVRDFAQTAPFKVLFSRNEQNLGCCGNFNAALMKTTGGLVFLSDQDDVWFPEKIEYMVSLAERNPDALVLMNDAALTDGELKEVGLTKLGQIRSAGMSLENFVMGCCCAIRREQLDMCMPIPEGFKAHDGWIVWFADGLRAKIVDYTPLQYYRRHESNESQFIANRTAPVTRGQAFVHTVKGILSDDSLQKSWVQIAQLTLFKNGTRRAIDKASEQYKSPLADLLLNAELRITTLTTRTEIREKWLLPRIVAVVGLVLKGGYASTSGFKAVARDIVG